ncbi:MAG: exo-alpha-sialidase [Methanobacteriota archaeon]|nr:MAG: exo-alpha-sialidase [Euryarchaeota archaeon]
MGFIMRGVGVRAVAVVAIGLFLALLLPPGSASSTQSPPVPPSPLSDSGPHPTAFVPFSPNLRVNTVNLGFGYQVEPTMVINSQGKIFVGWKEAFTHNGGGQRVAFATSSDGGNTFSTNILMPLSQLPRQSDPWLTVTRDDRVYFTRIEYDNAGATGGISVTNTTDGVTWGTTYFYNDAPNFADKESAAHDAAGDLYWVWNTDAPTRQDLAFARSSDGGATWTPKVLVSGPGTLGGIVQVAPDGTVLATWWSYASDNILFDRSFDGGATWGSDIRVNDIPGSAASPLPSDPPVLPSMAVAPNGTIYIAYEDYRNGRPGGTPNGDMDVFIARSSDSGSTWSPGIRLNDDTTTARQWMPDLAIDPFGGIHVAWEDDRTGAHNIYYTNSTDGGTTWGPNLRVTTAETPVGFNRPGDYLAIESAPDGTICIVWTDGRGADLDIYFAKLERTFPYTIDTTPAGLTVEVDSQPRVAPVTASWKPGSAHTVNAPSPQPFGPSSRHVFQSWSDGGGPSHTVTAGAQAGAIGAVFDTEHEVTVRTAPIPLDLLVDASPYVGAVTRWLEEETPHTIEAPSPQVVSPGTRYVFASWSDGGARSHTITPNGPSTVEATFQLQFFLTVQSAHGTPTGGGWYNASVAASFSVEGSAPGGTGTRYVFTGWTGDSTASSADSTIAMDGPKTVSASWRTDHLLTIVSAYGVAEGAGWYAENTAATASVPDRVTANGTTYRFAGWTGASTSSSSVTLVTMDGPKALTATWVVVPPETPSTSPGLGVLPWIALVVIAVIAFLFLFIWYRRRRKEDESRPPPTA